MARELRRVRPPRQAGRPAGVLRRWYRRCADGVGCMYYLMYGSEADPSLKLEEFICTAESVSDETHFKNRGKKAIARLSGSESDVEVFRGHFRGLYDLFVLATLLAHVLTSFIHPKKPVASKIEASNIFPTPMAETFAVELQSTALIGDVVPRPRTLLSVNSIRRYF